MMQKTGEDTGNANNDATNTTYSATTSSTSATTRSSDTYIYDVSKVAVLAQAFAHITKNLLRPRIKNKSRNL